MKENLRQGLPKDDAQAEACSLTLPVAAKKLRHLYLQYLRWYHDLKTNKVHKKVMKTLRSFMEDDEMEYTEAAEAAVSKRKYLLNSLFDPEDTSTEDDYLTYEARNVLRTFVIKSATTDSIYVTESQERMSAFCKCTAVYNIALNKGDDSIIIFITDDFDLLRFTPVTRETQGDFSGESIIRQQRFVGIILTCLYNAASNFE